MEESQRYGPILNKSWAVTTCVSALSSALSVALVALFIKIILNRFLQFKQLGIVVEKSVITAHIFKKMSGLNRAQAHYYSYVSGRVRLEFLGPI